MFAIGAVSFDTPEDAKHYVPLPPAAEELGSREDARSAGRHVGTPSGRTDTWKKRPFCQRIGGAPACGGAKFKEA